MSNIKQVARMDWRTVIKAEADTGQDAIDSLDKYFSVFAQPPGAPNDDGRFVVEKGHPCLKCGEKLNDGWVNLMGGSGGGFKWGLAHGEGFCGMCHWPARAYHFVKDANGETLMTIRNIVLQYHPDFVIDRAADDEDEAA